VLSPGVIFASTCLFANFRIVVCLFWCFSSRESISVRQRNSCFFFTLSCSSNFIAYSHLYREMIISYCGRTDANISDLWLTCCVASPAFLWFCMSVSARVTAVSLASMLQRRIFNRGFDWMHHTNPELLAGACLGGSIELGCRQGVAKRLPLIITHPTVQRSMS